ncbi:MAG: diaminopimelate dehydrogenase [Eubacteriales bacterium]|nr:diaminopimelate dehydrogenase [Eubacteriales bacterium]MDD3198807.1 diaminopimelate dehydrogenase [Eubacteriales bacterium]MDD4121952.1 diaminopimelate dehydrogenase [Eubacteriales bacterium]MDD4629757.1 diaminopimelate dehydrogenase [Eubacteriales bacterium]
MNKIKIGIAGYGNLGKSVELGIRHNKDMELIGIFTRRDPSALKIITEGVQAYHFDQAANMKDKIDVMILCGGSMADLPEQGPYFAGMFNTVDGFDTHAKIAEYFKAVDKKALESGKVCMVSCGWDPGMFSINRVYADAILPEGGTYTFWGKGISQGHSDAIRRVKGVKDGKQYTIPLDDAIEAVKRGDMPELSARQKHKRVCYIVAEEGADRKQIEHDIVTMPNYFSDYDTEVYFITEEELKKNHSGLPHGGLVIRFGKTGLNLENNHTIEYKLVLDSNPDLTANVLLAFARAAYRLSNEGISGAKTVVDIPPAYLSDKSAEELRELFI